MLRAEHPGTLVVVQPGDGARQPSQARAVGVEPPASRPEPDIDASLEGGLDQRLGGDEGFHHGVAVARQPGHALTEVQWNLVSHRLERDRILVDEHDGKSTFDSLDRSGKAGRARSDHQ